MTTLGGQAALAGAGQLLESMSFTLNSVSESHVEARRGVKIAARAKSIAELPQFVRVDFDRGRVTVAASLEVHGKARPLHADMLVALAESLDRHIAQGLPQQEAVMRWDDEHRRIDMDAACRRRRTRIIAVSLIVVIVGLLALPLLLG